MLARIGMNVGMVLLFCLAGLMLVPAALGFHRYVIQTGSMTGTYNAGSIVYDRPVPTSSLRVGDPITYGPPPGASPNHKLVTHRIYRITTTADGRRAFQTRGDFNRLPDNWRFFLPQATQDRVVFNIPYVGFAFEFLSNPQYRKLVIGIPAVLVAMWIVAGLWREGGEAQRLRDSGRAPWADDVSRKLPSLAGLDGDPAAGRAPVHVAISWPTPAPGRRRERAITPRELQPPPALPVVEARADHQRAAGLLAGRRRVALPDACVPRTRGRTVPRSRMLAPDWRLVVRRPLVDEPRA